MYRYDQLNRLVKMSVGTGPLTSSTWPTASMPESLYKEQISYDPNGNILTYLRNGTASNLPMDDMTYQYPRDAVTHEPINNRLRYVHDISSSYTEDIKTQTSLTSREAVQAEYLPEQTTDNYQYDAIGNLTGDASEGISDIACSVYGKIISISKQDGSVISYTYDAGGNRISKTANGKTSFYVRDAGGNVMSVYEKSGTAALVQKEVHLYGSSRLGILCEQTTAPVEELFNGGRARLTVFTRGEKVYELTNHLGNVLVTVSDKKIGHDAGDGTVDYYTADVLSAQDYYPFGQLQPGRQYGTLGRYGFNGKEQDEEVKGTGAQYDYGFRIYDPRLGRFLSVDPLSKTYPWYTPYQFAGNKPIWAVDLDGLEETGYTMFLDRKYSTVQGATEQNETNKKMYKAVSTAMFKSVFSESLPKKFLDHYAWGNGTEYKLNMNEVVSLNVAKTGIQGITQTDVDKFAEMTSSVRTRVRRGNRSIESKHTIIQLDNYEIQGAANVGGTLGRFTIQLQGKLTINSKDKTWSFEGKMRYFDTYDFKTNSVGEGDLQRSDWGDFQTSVGNTFLLGKGFNVTSDWINVKQSSSDPYFDFFKGKSEESKQNRVSNEIQKSTENGNDNEVPKTINETKRG